MPSRKGQPSPFEEGELSPLSMHSSLTATSSSNLLFKAPN